MNKDEEEFLSILKKRVNLPMIVDLTHYDPWNFTAVVTSAFRMETIWNNFYPSNENKMLMPFSVGKYEYCIEISPEEYDKTDDSVFINKIRKEIEEIKSGKEKFYFSKIEDKVSIKAETKKLKELFLKENPESTPVSIEWKMSDKYIIVGKDKSHLARTTIFMANFV